MGKVKSLVGKKFGSLTVLEMAGKGSCGSILWRCRCDCGNEIIARGGNLKNGSPKSCGCLHRAKELLPGSRFGRYIVIKHIGVTATKGRDLYLVKCQCGEEKILPKHNVISNKLGCHKCQSKTLEKDRSKIGHRLHGIWSKMLHRCYNIKDKNYNRYGGRGIKVCDEWKRDPFVFANWANDNGYREDLTIDRIDNNGNYEPSNCRWATRKEQSNNTSFNRFVEYNGETHTISEWSSKTGIKYDILSSRIRKGLPPEKCFYKGKLSNNGIDFL